MIITGQVSVKDLLEYWIPLSIVVDDIVAFTPIAIDVRLAYNLTILYTIQYQRQVQMHCNIQFML